MRNRAPIPSTDSSTPRAPAPGGGDRAWWLAVGLLVAGAWLLRAFVAPAGPFHEDFHGYAALGGDPQSVPGNPRVTSSYLALTGALGLRGDGMIAANRVVSALVVVPVALLARDLLGGTLPGLLAGAVVALHPLLARLGASEDPFAFYALTLLLAVVIGRLALRREHLVGFAGAALLASVAAFVRDSTVVAGPVFVLLAVEHLPSRRRLAVLGLALLPFAAGALRVLTFDALPSFEGASLAASLVDRGLLVARLATVGGLEVLRTPAAFPFLAVVGLGLLAWRRTASAARIVLALGLLQGPFAIALGGAASPYSPARHLSPAVVLWALPVAFALATVVELVPARLVRGRGLWGPVLGGLLLLGAMPDVGRLLAKTTVVEREYDVLKECLRRLPAEARYQPIAEARVSHVAAETAWFRAERPLWKPLGAQVLFDDRWADRHVPAVLLIDHGCSGNLTLDSMPDVTGATDETPWGPMVPACAEAFRARPWRTVVRVDLTPDDAEGARGRVFPVGCLIEAEAPE